MGKEYSRAIHKVERLNSLNSLRDYFDKEILNKSDAEIKINNYLNKYGIQSLFELSELFNQCFTEMKIKNLENYNLNIERLGIWERVNVDEITHYGLKYADTDIIYIIRNNIAVIEEAQDFLAQDFYIGVKCSPEYILICIVDNDKLLKIQALKDKIEIKEKIGNNVFKEEYYIEKAPFHDTIKHSSGIVENKMAEDDLLH